MTITDSLDLLERLLRLDLDVTARDPWWWPESGSFAMVVGAILTQQTRYQKVEASLVNLCAHGEITPERLAGMDEAALARAIQPSGFYRTKAARLRLFAEALLADFGDFDRFRREVDRDWLLARKGVGRETADAMLCYGCRREAMVVDAYTERLLRGFGLTFGGYDEIQSWLLDGLAATQRVRGLMGEMPVARVHALYHGLIVEYAKRHSRGREVDVTPLCAS